MAVQITYPPLSSDPNTSWFMYNGVYGKNIITLYNTTAEPVYFTLRNQTLYTDLYNVGTLKQSINGEGYSHFDFQTLLRNDYRSYGDLESITKIFRHRDYEEQGYFGYIGYINSSGAEIPAGNFNALYVTLPVRKNFYELELDLSEYIIDGQWGTLFTDYTFYSVNNKSKSLTDFPTLDRTITRDEDYTLTFIGNTPNQEGDLVTRDRPLTDFWFKLYDETDTLLDEFLIQNIQANGGVLGSYPADANDNQLHDFTLVSLDTVSIGAGRSNTTLQLALDSNPTTKYYTVSAAYGSIPSGTGGSGLDPVALSEDYKFTLGECEGRDYSHIQLSWINSFGFRDYFTFTKKHEERLSIKRNNYDRQPGDWSGVNFTINSYERGKTQFNSQVTQTYSLQTKFLTDEENEYLKNLLISPDVKMRFEGETTWNPVVLNTNSWTERTFRKDKFFQLELQVEMANKITTQNNQ